MKTTGMLRRFRSAARARALVIEQDAMSQLQNSFGRFRVVPGGRSGAATQDVILHLREQADHIDDTAKRCTDPAIVSELQHISSDLRERAKELARQ